MITFAAERVGLGIALAALSGVPGLFLPRSRRGELVFAGALGLAALFVLSAAIEVLVVGGAPRWETAWAMPGGAFALRIDALSAFFLAPIFFVSALAAVYGLEYWPEADHPENGRRLRFVFGLMVAGLGLTVAAANAIVFLLGWEVMALCAFAAVGTEDQLEPVRQASYLYLITTRVGTLAIFAMFALLHSAAGSWALEPLASLSPGKTTAVLLLGLVGFGIKAGVMPGHVWLPPAHAAAPSHVSATMSGVLIKIGIYGLLRLLWLLPALPAWCPVALLWLGAVSAVLGVVFAISQHDVKRLLAYHSIENIGIIVLGVGVAALGRVSGRPELVALGLAGALFHVWNHGLFKALLFLSAGSVVHACGTREIDRLGGLGRKMPRAALLFLLGSVAIAGLPPLNGFVSELFVYLGLFAATQGPVSGAGWTTSAVSIGALALVGGLALACFVKVYGAVFLGSARSEATQHAHDGGRLMTLPMSALALLCVAFGTAPLLVGRPLDSAVALFGVAPPVSTLAPLPMLAVMALILGFALAGLAWVLNRRVQAHPVAQTVTWDCGYAAPTARMQYTSSSFADFLVGIASWVLRPERHAPQLTGVAPKPSHFESHVADTFVARVFQPAVNAVVWCFHALRFLQPGRIHLYVLYVVATLIALTLWAKGAVP